MKVAIVHDYLIDFGGAERVLLALHEIYPKAPLYTLIVDKKKMGNSWKKFAEMEIHTSWFNDLPFASKLISPFRFLLPILWGGFDLSEFDLIIDSSSWAITRGFKTRPDQLEICYCHTPPRYLYGYDTSRSWNQKWYGKLITVYATIVNHFMRIYDFKQSKKVDYFLANSKNVAQRIEKFYRRDSTVIYPPIETPDIKTKIADTQKGDYFLTGGRFVSAKNFDLIIKACIKANVKLKIFGSGILENELKNISNENIEFMGKVGDEELHQLYTNAQGFIVAQKDEDFGMTVVEAQSYGCPVIAFRGGGYLETITEGKNGIFFEDLTTDSVVKALRKSKKIKWSKTTIIRSTQKFSEESFKKNILNFVKSKSTIFSQNLS